MQQMITYMAILQVNLDDHPWYILEGSLIINKGCFIDVLPEVRFIETI